MSWKAEYRARVELGDCRELLKGLRDDSIDSIVTDPPYEIAFMGKQWDAGGSAHDIDVWRECLRVLKPGGHILAFGACRTYHRLACAIEDAGFEIRDSLHWIFGSGFPKSLNVSAAIDKAAGAEREVVGQGVSSRTAIGGTGERAFAGTDGTVGHDITAPATDDAKKWDGWGTALKPSVEVVVMARKPFKTTVAENVLTHGTGAINIDGCRTGTTAAIPGGLIRARRGPTPTGARGPDTSQADTAPPAPHALGRWPANIVLDEYAAAQLDADNDPSRSRRGRPRSNTRRPSPEDGWGMPGGGARHDDEGGPSRYFYCAKTSRKEREEGLAQALQKSGAEMTGREPGSAGLKSGRSGASFHGTRANNHPTVKPIALMRWLCRLVTPPGGVVLDPFTGSGSTGIAASIEGFEFIGFERSAEYVELARSRISNWNAWIDDAPERPAVTGDQLDLFGGPA